MNSPVSQIKERLSIEDIVSSYIKLERAGANLKARCPFHNEKSPSFFVSPDRGSYYCFGCGAKGDIFSFIQEFEGLDFKGALKLLAEKAGVTIGVYDKQKEGEREKLFRIMEEATFFFEKEFSKNEDIKKYLKDRGIEDKTLKEFRVGYAPLEWRALYEYLVGRGWKNEEIEKAGLAKKSEKPSSSGQSNYYDRFRGRIMFPISDSSGRVIAFSGRIFVDDGKSAKYLNSPDTPIFSKFSVLYGLDKAKESIRKNNFSILVEGQMDLVLSHQAGFRNTVATSGTALSDATISKENVVSNLGLLRRLSGNIVLAFDGDEAGLKASSRAGKIALSLGMDVKVIAMKEDLDPADLIQKAGKDGWRNAIKGSVHIIEFLLAKISNNKDSRAAGREIKEKILPFVAAIESSIEQAHFIRKINSASGIPEDALREDLKKVKLETKNETVEIKKAEQSTNRMFRKDYIERRLIGVAFWQKQAEKKLVDSEKIINDISETLGVTKEDILKKWQDKIEDLIYEAEVFYGGDIDFKKDVDELLNNLKEEFLKESLFKKMQELRKSEDENDMESSKKVLADINEINKKIQSIKNSRLKK